MTKYERRMERKREEKVLLYQVFQEGCDTDEQKLIGYRNAQLVENCLIVMKMKTLMGVGSKGTGAREFRNTLDGLLEKEIVDRHELGLVERTKVNLSDVSSVDYKFFFKIVKVKSEKLRLGQKAIRYNNSQVIIASNIDSARIQLIDKLKKLGDTMVEELSVVKRVSSITTVSGKTYSAYAVEIINDVN